MPGHSIGVHLEKVSHNTGDVLHIFLCCIPLGRIKDSVQKWKGLDCEPFYNQQHWNWAGRRAEFTMQPQQL